MSQVCTSRDKLSSLLLGRYCELSEMPFKTGTCGQFFVRSVKGYLLEEKRRVPLILKSKYFISMEVISKLIKVK